MALGALGEIPGLIKAWLEWDKAKMETEVKLQTERITNEIDTLKDQIIALADAPSPANELRIEILHARTVRKSELLRSLRSAPCDVKSGGQIPVR